MPGNALHRWPGDLDCPSDITPPPARQRGEGDTAARV